MSKFDNMITLFDLSEVTKRSSVKMQPNQINLYNRKQKGLTVNSVLTEKLLREGKIWFRIGKNEFTKEVYFMFSNIKHEKSTKLFAPKPGSSSRYLLIYATLVIDLIFNILELDINIKSGHKLFLSEDLNNTTELSVYKIKEVIS